MLRHPTRPTGGADISRPELVGCLSMQIKAPRKRYREKAGLGSSATVNVAVQNTSTENPGMCISCQQTMPNLGIQNLNMKINIFQGTTGKNP